MPDNKKEGTLKKSGSNEEFNKSVDELADILIKEEEKNYTSELEPFEVHAQRMRKEIHENMEDFRDRFLQGYELLLKELAQQYTGSEDKGGKVPPGAIKL